MSRPVQSPPRRSGLPFSAAVLVLLLAGCAAPPDLGNGTPPASGPWPQIAPLPGVRAAAEGVTIAPQTADVLEARAESLRQRAARLRARQIGD